ncbi:hypothetical protein AMTRI_Chr10g231240 [Amborella trichopoda]
MEDYLQRLMWNLKGKLRGLKTKKYTKVDKSESMRMEMRSRKAQKLIAETFKIADSPANKSLVF